MNENRPKGNQKHIDLSGRIRIEQGLNNDESFRSIARDLNKDPSTISKEVRRHSVIKERKHRKKINESDFCNCSLVLNQNELNGEVERHIMDLVNNKDGRDFIIRRMESRVYVSSLEKEREQLRGQLRQLSGAKKKLMDMLDRLDVSDKHYDRKYQDMHDRLDNLYDKIGDIDDQLQDVNEKIRMAYENQITSKQVYQILTCFDKIYFEMTDLEKKEFFRNFIDEIELYSERQRDGRIVKQINFNFPVYYNGNEGNAIRLLNENTVETVCLLSNRNRMTR